MQKNHFRKIFCLAFICLVFACVGKTEKDPYVLSHLPNIQAFEKQDHRFCAALKLDYDKSDNLKSGLYWRCRLSMAKYRYFTDTSNPDNAKHNSEITDLVSKISLKLADTPESILNRENKKMDSRQHQQCLAMGYVTETEDQTKIDDYFACRRALLEDFHLLPPFGNAEYLNYPNRSYNLGFVIDQRVDEEIARFDAAKEKYPTCVKYGVKNVNFGKCTAAQDQSRQCMTTIDKKKFDRDAEEKIICQKRSYVQYPDRLLKESLQSEEDIAKMKAKSDYYNQYSFASLGLDGTQFYGDEKQAEREKEEAKKSAQNINTKDGLYDRFELTKLRRRYIFGCQKEADLKVAEYVEHLKKECENLTKFEVIGEE